MKELDFTKPLISRHHSGREYLYVGSIPGTDKHAVALSTASGNVYAHVIDKYGRFLTGVLGVINKPEPPKVYWANIYDRGEPDRGIWHPDQETCDYAAGGGIHSPIGNLIKTVHSCGKVDYEFKHKGS